MEVVAALLGIGALLLVLLVPVGLYVSRQRTLSRRVGSFACQMRGEGESTWTAGTAHFGASTLVWWRTLSLSVRPAHTWSRSELTLVERVRLDQVDEYGGVLLRVDCRHHEERFQLTMSEAACAGLVSWLESGPRPVGRVI